MRIETEAIICGVRSHGEHGAVVRALTPSEGMQPGFVRGGRSRRLRPVLVPGNTVQAEYRSRTDEQLAQLSVELVHSRAFLLAEALPSEAIAWATSLTAAVLPDGQPYPQLYQALEGLLGAIEAAPSARGWAAALVRYELLLLSELGFGLDLGECAVTGGREALAYVSPRSGRAVSSEGAEGYRDRLLVLPAYLQAGGQPDWPEIGHGLKLTGHFLDRDLLIGRAAEVRASRDRLIDRLRRIAPLPS